METNTHFSSYLIEFILLWEIFRDKFVVKFKTHFLRSITVSENRSVYDIIWQNTVQSDGHVLLVLDNYGKTTHPHS